MNGVDWFVSLWLLCVAGFILLTVGLIVGWLIYAAYLTAKHYSKVP